MSVQVISEENEKEITMLSDVDVQFVSLVRHGANQQPFRVVKSDGKGGAVVSENILVLQSLLVSKEVDLSKLAEKDGLGWLSDVDAKNLQEFDEYNKVVQVPEEKMDMGSIQMVKIHADGAWALVGKLAEGESMDGILTVSADVVNKALDLMSAPMEQAIATTSIPVALSFGQLFDKELGAFLDVVYGSLNQSGQDAASRKKAIIKAVDALKAFLSVGLDSLQEKSAELEKMILTKEDKAASHLAKHSDVSDEKGTSEKSEGGVPMFSFETEQDFLDAVAKITDARIAAAKEDAEKAEADSAAKAASDKKEADAKATIDGLVETVKGLEKTVKELSGEPVTTAAANEDADGDQKVEKKDPNLFKGAIFGK